MKHLLVAPLLVASTTAMADSWIFADCMIQNGEKIAVALTHNMARISYNGETPQDAFPKFDGDVFSVVHISGAANLAISVDSKNGRGFVIARPDRGRELRYNAMCKMEVIRR